LIRFSTLQHAYDSHPAGQTCTWPQLLDALSVYTYRSVKEQGPLISPATFTPPPVGAVLKDCKCHPGDRSLVRKSKPCVEAVHFLALDFDDVTPDKTIEILKSLEPYAAITYTTWKQPEATQKGVVRFRAMLPMSRSVSAADWPVVYACAVRDFGASALDESCKDPNRFYFTPALPLDAQGQPCSWAAQLWRSPGTFAWDVDGALARPRPAQEQAQTQAPAGFRPGKDPIPREAVMRLSAKLSGSADPKNIRLGTLMRSGLDGHLMANQGEGHTVLRDVGWRLGIAFPTGDATEIAEHFRQSLDLMTWPGAGDALKHFAELIVTAQAKTHADALGDAAARLLGSSKNIQKAFEGLGLRRGTPYTAEELAQWSAQAPLDTRWILLCGSAVWLFFAGDYVGPFMRETIGPACAQWLSPASSAGVEVHKYDEKGNVKIKDLHELISSYGRTVLHVEADLAAPVTYLDAARSAVVEAPCPVRALSSEYSPDVDGWLRALAGPKYDRLCDWIACLTFLQECTPAVFIKGASGVGKNLAALGLARLWSTAGPTPMAHALGQFNAEITHCPLVYADEQIPETFRGEPRTEELRELITSCTFKINQKNRPVVSARGSARVIIGANNFNAISRKAELTPEDAQALADRFILIDAGTEDNAPAKDYLKSRGGPAHTADWVSGDRIAKHALWLRDEVLAGRRVLQRGSRFLLPGDAQELVTALQTTSRIPSDLLEWIWQFLRDPGRHVGMSTGRGLAALVKDGAVWIDPRAVLQSWDHYMGSERAPTANAFKRTTRGIVLSERAGGRLRLGKGGTSGKYQRLELNALRGWLSAADEDLAELDRLLTVDTETLGVPGQQRAPGLN
jgi:hypothetical protein